MPRLSKRRSTRRKRCQSKKRSTRRRKQRGGLRADLKVPPVGLSIKRRGDVADDIDTMFTVGPEEPVRL